MEVIGLALDAGLVSVRRVASLLDLSTEALSALLAAHGFAGPTTDL